MNLTNKGTFKVGNSIAKANAGKKHKSTIVKEKLGIENLNDLKGELIECWITFLRSNVKDDRKFALKEISKYIFAVKKEVSQNHTGKTFEDFLRDIKPN